MATYTITELAQEFDITPRAIRFYEDRGLISPSREGAGGRNRVYTARDRTHLKLTLRGKRLGLSLSDIKSLVDMYSSPKDTEVQLQSFLTVLARHRAALELQREDIEIMLDEIRIHEEKSMALLAQTNKSDSTIEIDIKAEV
ncbi:MAG: MerR family DNA-binding transcriptional regulator [Burkholderiaceae bacterium]|jgi:DNA-binding transcriptional MerR regulator|nr:MerR family DNA-binding transcriptional regulator [Burkholderiaceae bacterium]